MVNNNEQSSSSQDYLEKMKRYAADAHVEEDIARAELFDLEKVM